MDPMKPVDLRQVRTDRVSTQTRVRQAVVMLCAIPFVVLVMTRAPLWGWGIAVVCALLFVSSIEYVLRRQGLNQSSSAARR